MSSTDYTALKNMTDYGILTLGSKKGVWYVNINVYNHQFTTCQLSTGIEEAMLDEKWLPQCCECFSVVPFVTLY